MARKRSLKDAAADRLVEKNKTVPEAPPAPAKKKGARPRPVKAAIAEPPNESPVTQPPALEAPPPPALEVPQPPEERKISFPPLVWKGIPLLVGCAAGYFFGLGHATGPANMSFLLIGIAAGYFLGRFTKIP
jgi:hypothetical protein